MIRAASQRVQFALFTCAYTPRSKQRATSNCSQGTRPPALPRFCQRLPRAIGEGWTWRKHAAFSKLRAPTGSMRFTYWR
jgi:hypothetical protein